MKTITVICSLIFALAVVSVSAATVHWDGEAGDGLWSSATNWSGDALPANGDVITIDGATVVWDISSGSGNLPAGCSIVLTNSATLTSATVLRMNGSTLSVGSGSIITGSAWWDLNGGTFFFEDGASATMDHWEQKGQNHFTFKLGETGFSTLTPGTFWESSSISNASYTVDMADYNGGAGTISLVNFNDAAMDSTAFQAAGLTVTNAAAAYAGAFIVWNNDAGSIELQLASPPDRMSLSFGADARPVSLVNTNGTELLSSTPSDGFYLLESDNSRRRFDTVTDLGGGEYRFEISGSSEQVTARFTGTNHYMTVQFTGLSGFALNAERLFFELYAEDEKLRALALDYMVDASESISPVRVERWSVWETNTWGAFALYEVVDEAQEDDVLLDLWVNEGLPHPAVTGVWDRAAAEAWLDRWIEMATDTSYLNMVPDTLGEHYDFLPYADAMDATAVYFWNEIWRGEYWLLYRQNDEVNPDMYPNGLSDLEALRDLLANDDRNLMLHYLAANIGEVDPEFTATTVHPDLQSWGTVSLSQPVSSSSTSFSVTPDVGVELPIISSNGRLREAPPVIPSFFEFKTFRIGSEWVSASSVTDQGNGTWLLSGVVRGKWNTTAASYSSGENLRGYLRPYNQDFVPDPNSALMETIASRWAALNNTLQTTKSEFDGFENCMATGLWGTEKFGSLVYSHLDHPSTANTSSGRPPDAWLEYRFNRVKAALGGDFQTRQHASLFLGDESRTTPGLEEIENEMNKFLNLNNRGFSLGSYDVKGVTLSTLAGHGFTGDILELLKDWKDASFALSPAERASMDNFRPYDDARLSINGNHPWAESLWRLDGSSFRKWHAMGTDVYTHEWHFGQEHGTITPRFYLRNGSFQTLEIPSEISAGAEKLRIVGRVLPRFDGAAAGNIDLMSRMGLGSSLTVNGSNATGSDVWKDSDLTKFSFSDVDLRSNRGIGCWVTGDNSGALLLIRLHRNGTARDYTVPVNFTGRRWIEVPTGEASWRIRDWGWNGSTRWLDYQYINAVSVGFGHIPSNTTCSVLVEELTALAETAEALVAPTITLGGESILLSNSIPSESHFVLDEDGIFTVYDTNWNPLFFQTLESYDSQQANFFQALETNQTAFGIQSASSTNIWLEVGVQASAEAIHNPAYTTNGTPKRWLNEYGLSTDLIDEDFDGHFSWEEYIAGTDPTNSASVFRLSQTAPQTFQWSTVSGKTYTVWFKTNLLDSSWIDFGPASGSFTVQTDSTSGFVRVDVAP